MANPRAHVSFASLLPPPRHGRSRDDDCDDACGKKPKTECGDISASPALPDGSSSLFTVSATGTTPEPPHTTRRDALPLPFFPKEASKLGSVTVPKTAPRGLLKNGAIPKCAPATATSGVPTTKNVLTVKSSAPKPKVWASAPAIAPVARAVGSNSPPPPWRDEGGRDSPPPWRSDDARPAFAKTTPTAPALSIPTAAPVPSTSPSLERAACWRVGGAIQLEKRGDDVRPAFAKDFGTALDMMSEAKQKQDIGTALDMLAAAQKPLTQFERLMARLMRERDNKILSSFPAPTTVCSTVPSVQPVPSAPPRSDLHVPHNATAAPVPTLKQIVNTYRLDMCSARELQRLDQDTCRRVIEECRERLASALYDPSELILSTIKSVVGRASVNSVQGRT